MLFADTLFLLAISENAKFVVFREVRIQVKVFCVVILCSVVVGYWFQMSMMP
jgi:hypothetical protein